MACPLCDRVNQVRARGVDDPFFLAELSESFAVLHEHQAYPGWCVLWLKDHADHLADLPPDRQTRLFADVARVASAVRAAVRPVRLNYACLGNVVAHVHWHVIPRHADDPRPRDAVWARPPAEIDVGVDPALRDRLVIALRRELAISRSGPAHPPKPAHPTA